MVKPCPFCKSIALEVGCGTRDHEGLPVYVYCEDCGCNGPWRYTKTDSVANSLQATCDMTGWNNRA